VIAAVLLFQLCTIRQGQGWTGDFALYLQHAINIVEGNPYHETRFIPNPHNPFHSPKAYPPVYPLLLAPIYALRGIDLEALKLVATLLLPFALLVATAPFASLITSVERVALFALLGFSPYLTDFKSHIVSDVPFLLLTSVAVLASQISEEGGVLRKRFGPLGYGIAIGLIILAAIETRTVGITLVVALLVHALLTRRAIGQWQMTAALVAVAGSMALNRILLGGSGYLDALEIFRAGWEVLPIVVANNARMFFSGLITFWSGAPLPLVPILLAWGTLGTAIAGYVACCRSRAGLLEVFVPVYLLAILLWPGGEDIRLAIPIIPALIGYAVVGFNATITKIAPRHSALAKGLLAVVIAMSFVLRLSSTKFERFEPSVTDRDAQELFQAIRTNVLETGLVLSEKPRIISLFTSRPGVVFHIASDETAHWDFLESVHVSHVVLSRWHWDRSLTAFLRANAARFRLIFSNSSFGLYELTPI
jgi:hypothetical protein